MRLVRYITSGLVEGRQVDREDLKAKSFDFKPKQNAENVSRRALCTASLDTCT